MYNCTKWYRKTTLLNIIKLLAVNDKIVGNGEIMPVPPDGAVKAWMQIFDLEILRFINEGKVAGKYLNDGYFKDKGLKSEDVRNKYLKKLSHI